MTRDAHDGLQPEKILIQLCLADQETLAAALIDDQDSPTETVLPRLWQASLEHSKKVISK